MIPVEDATAEAENQHHRYRGNWIPWTIRLMWIGFWIFFAYYVWTFLIPALRQEIP
jgi:hypothetical protein